MKKSAIFFLMLFFTLTANAQINTDSKFINLVCNNKMVLADSTSGEQIDWKNIKNQLSDELQSDSSFYHLVVQHNNMNHQKYIIDNEADYDCNISILDRSLLPDNSTNINEYWKAFEQNYPSATGTTYITKAVNNNNYGLMIVSDYQSGSAGESSLFIFKLNEGKWSINSMILRWSD